MLDEFAESLAQIRNDEGARVLILRSLVTGVFCAGTISIISDALETIIEGPGLQERTSRNELR